MKDKKSSFQESGYSEHQELNFSDTFSDVRPISTTGTTCDAFSARYESRLVFVKRLKKEHVSNPRYRIAFKKEYELGVTLRHPSIPLYIKCTGDALITEFVDGKTLHQMLQEKDPRLENGRNIEKWVSQLLEVLDYLHARNVMHCDVKTDNIMITNETRNLILVDFDKAYTASQDSTAGTPLNYGSEEEILNKRQMDIRGLRNIIETLLRYVDSPGLKIRMENLVASSCSPEVTMPELLEIWKHPVSTPHGIKTISKRTYLSRAIGVVILVALITTVWSYFPKKTEEISNNQDSSVMTPEPPEDSIVTPAVIEKIIRDPVVIRSGQTDQIELQSLIDDELQEFYNFLKEVDAELRNYRVDPAGAQRYQDKIVVMNERFNLNVEKIISTRYPALSTDSVLNAVYASPKMKQILSFSYSLLSRLDKLAETPDMIEELMKAQNEQKNIQRIEKDTIE